MLNKQHKIHNDRAKKNIFVGSIMIFFVILIFSVTLVKLATGNKMHAYDHTLRLELLESGEDE